MRHGHTAGGKSADEGRRRERNITIGGDMVVRIRMYTAGRDQNSIEHPAEKWLSLKTYNMIIVLATMQHYIILGS